MRYPPIGEAGQRRLAAARVLICGCGALGSVAADILARAGVGRLRIVDRDFLETSNLQRQVLFDEADVAAQLPKAVAAAQKLGRINSAISVEPVVADVTARNILDLCREVDLIIDGTDNFETRFLLNEAALRLGIPWIYGGAIGATGQTMTIVPQRAASAENADGAEGAQKTQKTPCFRCVMPEPPPPGSTPTCDSAGILAPASHVVAALQANEALKILSGNGQSINRHLTIIDLWDNTLRQIGLTRLAENGCATCRDGDEPWLSGRQGSQTAVLCGRNAVQLAPAVVWAGPAASDRLAELAKKLSSLGRVTSNAYLLRLSVDPYTLTLFADGRTIVSGTDDVSLARTLYARYVGM